MEQAYEYEVSICCLAFNHEPYIRKALDSFLMQKTDFKFEVVIHDDHSTDQTAAIIREYEERYPAIIHPLYQAENQYSQGIRNISGAFNFPRAQGKYIAMCEGDDFWCDDHKLKLQVDYMEAHPDCMLCFHAAGIESEDQALRSRRIRPYVGDRICTEEDVIDKKANYPTASLLFRTASVKHLPKYYEECPVGDIPLQIYLVDQGYAYYMDRRMSVYRQGVAVSWSEQMEQGNYEQKLTDHHRKMKEMFTAFDRETYGRYHEAVENAMQRMDFLTQLNVRHYRQARQPQYRRYYLELPLRTRMLIDLELYCPAMYRLLQKAWYGLHR
ncbi:MAG: glycosyltransferase family A protein [Hungatella sp.]